MQLTSTRAIVAAIWLFAPMATAQQSADPAINDFWNKPDMDEAVAMLERDYPTIYKYRHAIVAALGLERGSEVADVGAGTGFIARLMAHEVGPGGTVYAQDISQESLDYNIEAAEKEALTNVRPVLGDQHSTNLPPGSVDAIVTIRTYHHFEHPDETLASIHAALRPHGRFVVIDYERIRGVTIQEDYEHMRAGKGTFTDEIVDAGFVLAREIPLLPENFYFLVFEKRPAVSP